MIQDTCYPYWPASVQSEKHFGEYRLKNTGQNIDRNYTELQLQVTDVKVNTLLGQFLNKSSIYFSNTESRVVEYCTVTGAAMVSLRRKLHPPINSIGRQSSGSLAKKHWK